jgi:hypothetical protein
VIKFRDMRVTGFTRQFYDIYWEIHPTTEDIQEYTFTLQRSEGEAGPWENITPALVDRYFVRDNNVPLINQNRTLFYRVECRHTPTGKVLYSPTTDRWGKQDLIAAEVIRLETLLFEEFVGNLGWLFPRRTFGQRCPQCWDDVLQKRIDDRCPTCYGTGFSGGYHYPIQFYLQEDEAPLTVQPSMHDVHMQSMMSFRCPSSPDIKPLDMLVDHKNRRMRVTQVHGTGRLGVTIRQEVQAVVLQPGSIEDSVPLLVDTESLEFNGWRNYSNPQNPEAADASTSALDRLLGRYGY